MSSKQKRIPKFRTEKEEREFWESHESTDYVDWSKAQILTFPELRPSHQAISLRLPRSLLEQIKVEANKRDVPYQSLIKIWLSERVDVAKATPPGSRKRTSTSRRRKAA